MKSMRAVIVTVTFFGGYKQAMAITSQGYGLIQESLCLVFSISGLILSLLILASFKRGSLSTPWLLFAIGFGLLAGGAITGILESIPVLLHEYDLRLWTLISRAGSILLFAIALILYRNRLS